MAKEYLIGDFLKRIKRPIKLIDDQEYKLVTIKMNHNGVVLREHKKGALIKSNMYEVKKGDFILSGIDARNGAFGIVPPEIDGAIVTNDFWYFEIDENIISKRLFLELTATTWFDEICKRGSDGTTQRIRLQKNKFFNQSVMLPEGNEQKELLAKILKFKEGQENLVYEIQTQKQLLSQLKQSILQEAIQGKLTADWRAQNSNTEPASELLKRIKAEKAQLIKDKEIKKEKPLPPITEDEIPFALPEGWDWTKLGDIGKSIIGLVYKPTNVTDNGTPVLRANNIVDYKLVETNLVRVNCEVPENKIAEKGDILICVRSGSKKLIGKSAIIDKEGYSFGAFNTLYKSSYNEYIHLFLMSTAFTNQINDEKSTGINQLTQGVLRNLIIPLPPLEEQRAIVEKVESLTQKCQALEEEIKTSEAHAQMLMQAVLKEAFEGKKEVVEV